MQNNRGFTLVELLLVTVLLAMMSGILYASIGGIIRSKKSLESKRDSLQIATYVLERMTRELSSRLELSLANGGVGAAGGAASLAGVSSLVGVQKEYLQGEDGKIGTNDADTIRFTSASSGQSFFDSLSNSGVVEITYRLSENTEKTDDLSFGTSEKDLVMVREEVPADTKEKEIVNERKVIFPMAYNVVSFNLRYLKEGKWQNEWTEKKPVLPEAIEMTIKLRGEEDSIQQFKTAVGLKQQTPKQNTPPGAAPSGYPAVS